MFQMLALALVHVQLDCFAVAAMKGFVFVQHGLDVYSPAGTFLRLRIG